MVSFSLIDSLSFLSPCFEISTFLPLSPSLSLPLFLSSSLSLSLASSLSLSISSPSPLSLLPSSFLPTILPPSYSLFIFLLSSSDPTRYIYSRLLDGLRETFSNAFIRAATHENTTISSTSRYLLFVEYEPYFTKESVAIGVQNVVLASLMLFPSAIVRILREREEKLYHNMRYVVSECELCCFFLSLSLFLSLSASSFTFLSFYSLPPFRFLTPLPSLHSPPFSSTLFNNPSPLPSQHHPNTESLASYPQSTGPRTSCTIISLHLFG